MSRTYRRVLQEASAILAEAGVPDPELDAWYMLSHIARMDRGRYFLIQMEEVEDPLWESYKSLVLERAKRIPLQHLLGEAWFMGLSFLVNEHVLIPRQDTENLVEMILQHQKLGKVPKNGTLLDLCTGSGCIAISLDLHGEWSHVLASDLSEEALTVARQNGERNQSKVQFVHSDLFEDLDMMKMDVIVSNPPYIPTAEIDGLQPEVRDHDPFMALDGREDGLYFYRKLAEESPAHLKSGGRIYLEIGWDQGEAVSELLRQAGFSAVEVILDDAGKNRIVTGEWICLTD